MGAIETGLFISPTGEVRSMRDHDTVWQTAGDLFLTATVSFTLNGKTVSALVENRTLLVDLIRDELGQTGTHIGCDTSQCGACAVHVNGRSIKSCTMLAVQAAGASIMTIEGVAPEDGPLHPLQAAFREHHGLQCGFCTPGVIMSTLDLIARNPDPSDAEIRAWLEGNLCRCTGYDGIIKAIRTGAEAMRSESDRNDVAGNTNVRL